MHNLTAMRQFRRTSPLTCLMKLREPITLWVTSARIFFVGTPPLLLIDHLLTSLPHHTNNTPISVLWLSDIYSHFHIIHTFTFREALPQMIYQNCCPCLWTFTLTDPILQDYTEIMNGGPWLSCLSKCRYWNGLFCFSKRVVPSWMWVSECLLIQFWHPTLLIQGQSR